MKFHVPKQRGSAISMCGKFGIGDAMAGSPYASTCTECIRIFEGQAVITPKKKEKREVVKDYTGVSWYGSTGKWRAEVTYKGIKHHVGYFKSAGVASKARTKRLNQLKKKESISKKLDKINWFTKIFNN